MAGIMAVSLALTVLLEEAYAYLYGYRARRERILVCLVNCLTNPPVVALYYAARSLLAAAGWSGLWLVFTVPVLESLAVIVEWRCYRRFSSEIERPFQFSLLANVFSYGTGLLINLLAG